MVDGGHLPWTKRLKIKSQQCELRRCLGGASHARGPHTPHLISFWGARRTVALVSIVDTEALGKLGLYCPAGGDPVCL